MIWKCIARIEWKCEANLIKAAFSKVNKELYVVEKDWHQAYRFQTLVWMQQVE